MESFIFWAEPESVLTICSVYHRRFSAYIKAYPDPLRQSGELLLKTGVSKSLFSFDAVLVQAVPVRQLYWMYLLSHLCLFPFSPQSHGCSPCFLSLSQASCLPRFLWSVTCSTGFPFFLHNWFFSPRSCELHFPLCESAQRHCFHLTHYSSWQVVLDFFHTSLLIKQNIEQGRRCTALPFVVLGVLRRISDLVSQSISLQWWLTSHRFATSTTWNETVKTNYKTGPNLTRKLHIYSGSGILKMSWSDFCVVPLALVSV